MAMWKWTNTPCNTVVSPNVFSLETVAVHLPVKQEPPYANKPGSCRELLAVMEKTPTERYEAMYASIPTQYGKLMLAEFDYSNTQK
jgi:sulfide:quinone oxidoreductase